MKKLVLLRRLSQTFFFLFFLYVLWATTYPLKGPIKPTVLFDTDPFIMLITCVAQTVALPGLIFSAAMIALAVVFGRFFCGWICPLGSCIDIFGAFKKKKRELSDEANRLARRIKYYLFGAVLAFALLGVQIGWIFDPVVIAGRFLSMNLIPTLVRLLNFLFIAAIKYSGSPALLTDAYHSLRGTALGVKNIYFDHSLSIFAIFLLVTLTAFVLKRAWCRMFCPLGALYAVAGRFSPFKRVIDNCAKCGKCRPSCRMGAIKDDFSYVKSECVLCMDCVYDCPAHITRFGFRSGNDHFHTGSGRSGDTQNISRRSFLLMILGIFPLLGARPADKSPGAGTVLRPPAALAEEDFVNRCIRCGNCMKACITNGLQPVMFEAGPGGIWTPKLVPRKGYCEYNCVLCGQTCPTGAIPRLTVEQKHKVRLGLARIDKSLCLPWARGSSCIVCQEHCPVAEKAIKLDDYTGPPSKPVIDESLCTGCGICENKCPVDPVRAIKVEPRSADRT
jgi:MauM/NapG family ferredoxin protein